MPSAVAHHASIAADRADAFADLRSAMSSSTANAETRSTALLNASQDVASFDAEMQANKKGNEQLGRL
jgi:hypothetical protein